MKKAANFHYVAPKDVVVPEDRQRKDLGDIESLEASIKKHGILSPLILTKDLHLVAGERRLKASLNLNLEFIPIYYLEDLDPLDAQLIELAENVRRKQLSWQEECRALFKIAALMETQEGRKISVAEVANTVGGISTQQVYRAIQVAKELERGNEKILKAAGLVAAVNLITRQNVRKAESELSRVRDVDLFDAIGEAASEDSTDNDDEDDADIISLSLDEPAPKVSPKPKDTPDELKEIICGDFFDLVKIEQSKRFNFIHCDFPYGVGIDKSAQLNSVAKEVYDDSQELYFDMLSAFIEHSENFMADSCHIMFWFAMKFYEETVDAFLDADFYVNPYPLIWHKTDLKGILPDPARGPRRTYETALLISRGDRKVVRAVAGSHAAPTAKPQQHISQKPLPVLKHFFTMFVDGSSDVLDPTCGSGTSLVAAEDTGAFSVEGWELNPDYAEISRTNLRHYRMMNNASKKLKEQESVQ